MFFFFPYTTDAPIYYWPFATVGLIALNVLVFLGVLVGAIPNPEEWILAYGQGLHPLQWISSNFMHAGPGHLFGNMLFLWVFGLVVEGKLGWQKFLACYLGIGITQSMLEQIVMLGYSGEMPGSLGASSAIFGLMAMAAIWAPVNEITFFYVFAIRMGTFDVSIAAMAVVYTGLELLFMFLPGGAGVTSILHLSGFALGLPLGVLLLKRNIVDCEGWDAFHVWSGDYGAFKQEPKPVEMPAEIVEDRHRRDLALLAQAKTQLRQYLQSGNVAAVLTLRDKMKNVAGGLVLDRNELAALVNGLHKASRWADSAPFMAELIERFPNGADAARIKLAQICVVELNRPGKALDLLGDVNGPALPPPQQALTKKIAAKARQMQADGVFELDTETW